jgi:hypothetical protein
VAVGVATAAIAVVKLSANRQRQEVVRLISGEGGGQNLKRRKSFCKARRYNSYADMRGQASEEAAEERNISWNSLVRIATEVSAARRIVVSGTVSHDIRGCRKAQSRKFEDDSLTTEETVV